MVSFSVHLGAEPEQMLHKLFSCVFCKWCRGWSACKHDTLTDHFIRYSWLVPGWTPFMPSELP